jgi:hypothetical protein
VKRRQLEEDPLTDVPPDLRAFVPLSALSHREP